MSNTIGIYNFPEHVKGDTFDGQIFKYSENIEDVITPMDLTGASITLQLRRLGDCSSAFEFSTDNGLITIPNPTLGEFEIGSTIIDIKAGIYNYDIQVTFLSGEVKTYVKGNWKILRDVSV